MPMRLGIGRSAPIVFSKAFPERGCPVYLLLNTGEEAIGRLLVFIYRIYVIRHTFFGLSPAGAILR